MQQKQIAVLQAIIAEERGAAAVGFNMKVAKLPMFNRETSKMGEFIIVCRLYLRMRIRETTVKEQI